MVLGAETLRLVRPLMELRIKQHEEQFTDGGRWRGESQYTPDVDRLFETLLENRTRAGDEALAFLLGVYMGEHQGEELVCEIINRGTRMVPVVKAYRSCQPLTGPEPFPQFVTMGSRVLFKYALEGLATGKSCKYED